MVESIHKLKKWHGTGTVWEPICSTRTGSNQNRVTEDDSKVTCVKCLKLLNGGDNLLIVTDFFDPHDLQHIKAYAVLIDSGAWPEGFIPKGTIFPSGWQCFLAFKMTDAWMEYTLAQIRE